MYASKSNERSIWFEVNLNAILQRLRNLMLDFVPNAMIYATLGIPSKLRRILLNEKFCVKKDPPFAEVDLMKEWDR